jgi:hypothetical protein
VTQGAVNFGYANFNMAGGVWTGITTKTQTCSGDWIQPAGTVTDNKVNLIMTGSGKTLTKQIGTGFYSLKISGTTVDSLGSMCLNVDIDVGGELSIASGKVFTAYLGPVPRHYVNLGTVNGPGTLRIFTYESSWSLSFGVVNAPVLIGLHSAAAASYVGTMLSSATLGDSLTVLSSSATHTITLDLNGKSLSATSITASTRGIITDSVGGGTITGPITVNGTGAVLTEGSGIPLNIDGALTLTSGTVTQAGPINVTGALTIGGGVWTGDGVNDIVHGGILAISGITPTASIFKSKNNHHIDIYGTTTQSSISLKPSYKDNVNIRAGTHTCDVGFHCDNLNISSGTTFVQNAGVPIVVCRKTSNSGTYTQNTVGMIVSGVRYFRKNLPINFPINVAKVG